jgi:hypothetical protein
MSNERKVGDEIAADLIGGRFLRRESCTTACCDDGPIIQFKPRVGRRAASASPRGLGADHTAELAAALDGARLPWLRKDQWAIIARVYRPNGTTSSPSPRWLDAERPARRAGEFVSVLAAVEKPAALTGGEAIAKKT